ncbi:hypothetical protein Slin15195_G117270 [Septoria linicola]|uniref:Uncharacterized protein n=1 Tax=Septoria linicola TaxID=215465 RepID=A0A9Q9B6L6_9PEZI|nr:hypothetical protein Slin15195_G117270 [Septoria linicola]
MALHTLDLGRLDLVSTTSRLGLQLTSIAQVRTSDHPNVGPDSSLESSDSSSWASLARIFHIDIKILGLPEHMLTDQRNLHERLAVVLCDLPLWQQLQLHLSAKYTTLQSSSSTICLRIHLNHATDDLNGATRNVHKLAQDVPHHDIEPPDGIRKTELHTVALRMSFDTTSDCKRRKGAEFFRDKCVKQVSDHAMHRFTGVDSTINTPHDSIHATKSRRTRTTPERTTASARYAHLDAEPMPLDLNGPQLKNGTGLPLQSLTRCFSTSDIDMSSSRRCEDGVVDLLAAGLHYAIATPTKRSLDHVEVAGREAFKQLGDIWPEIFQPGYMESIASRAVFLPTITHALTQTCFYEARSMALRSKFNEVIRRQSTLRYQPSSANIIQDLCSSRLWNLMQHGLRSGRPSSRIIATRRANVASLNTSIDTEFAIASVTAELVGDSEDLMDRADAGQSVDELMLDLDELHESGMIYMTACSSPADVQSGHADRTSSHLRARDGRGSDAEDDLLSLSGSVNSLTLEESGCLSMHSGLHLSGVSSPGTDLSREHE